MARFKIICTRRLDPTLVEQAKFHDIEVVEQEFISIHPIRTPGKEKEVGHWIRRAEPTFVVFTSANAVAAVKHYLQQAPDADVSGWRIFCISDKTKQSLAPEFAASAVLDSAPYGTELAQKVIDHGVKEVLFFCGSRRRDELPTLLKAVGICVHEVVVYHTEEVPVTITCDADGVLFFSPSAVNSFFSANQLKPGIVCFAIGRTTAGAIAAHTTNEIIISDTPSQESLMAAVQHYFQ